MRIRSIFRICILLILSLVLGICISCSQGNKPQPQPPNSLDEVVCAAGYGNYYYFTSGTVYLGNAENGSWKKYKVGSYSSNKATFDVGGTITISINSGNVVFDNKEYLPIVTDASIIQQIKAAPIVPAPVGP